MLVQSGLQLMGTSIRSIGTLAIMYFFILAPKLGVSPLYFLKVPHDAEGHFKCSCDEANLAVCKEHNMAWALSNQTTEDTTFIYKDKQLLGDPQLYQIIPTDNGASKNLTIHGKLGWIKL